MTTDNFNEFVNNVDHNGRKTISLPTMHLNHINFLIFFVITSKLCILGFDIDVRCKSKLSRSRTRASIFVVCAHESHFSAIDIESAFRSAIGWRSTRCGTSRSIWIGTSSGSICMRNAATILHRRAADVRTHILADHIRQPFTITIKKESDDDG
jgi:hypothetical protein